MKRIDFELLCGKYNIEPSLAIEDKEIIAAIHQNDLSAVEDCLRDNF